jgi:hypothetical protein
MIKSASVDCFIPENLVQLLQELVQYQTPGTQGSARVSDQTGRTATSRWLDYHQRTSTASVKEKNTNKCTEQATGKHSQM